MKFSTQEDYGLRCLLRIAQAKAGASTTIPEIAEAEGLSTTHVAKMTMILRKEGFITSSRGHTGGYVLSRPTKEIRVSHVLDALGGRLYDGGFCERHSGQLSLCKHSNECNVRSLWESIQKAVDSVLEPLSLADLLKEEIPTSNVVFLSTPPARRR
jgi:Rrf2 family protein